MIDVSLCMIVKNEEEVLARCLDSVQDIVDEIIIVDTGSTDATKSIAALYTDKIFDFEWRDDFSAARNFSFSKATKEYAMWMDADDIMYEADRNRFKNMKSSLNNDVDVIMMPYNTAFDRNGQPVFTYMRERIVRKILGVWKGAVHEAIQPVGNIFRSDAAVSHRKEKAKDSDRNLRIYEKQLENGKSLDPREKYYFARELFYHGRTDEAIQVFENFLEEGKGWIENNISACQTLAQCYCKKGDRNKRFETLLKSFAYDSPRGEICCELGAVLMEKEKYEAAIFWFETALSREPKNNGAFIYADCYGYIPAIQLCVCYDRLGDREKAVHFNEMAGKFKPNDPAYKANLEYFRKAK